MILKGQPDLGENGRFFSLTLIWFINILLIAGFPVAASPRVSLAGLAWAAMAGHAPSQSSARTGAAIIPANGHLNLEAGLGMAHSMRSR